MSDYPVANNWRERIGRWVTTTNHKDIGALYMWLGFIMLFVGGAMVLVVRLELFQPGLQFVRVFTSAIGVGLFYLSLKYIPITEVVALSFVAPVFTIIGSVLFLKNSNIAPPPVET